jgi:hypothetical protein
VTVTDGGGAVVHKSPLVPGTGPSAKGDGQVGARFVIIHLDRSLHTVMTPEKQHDGVIPLLPG